MLVLVLGVIVVTIRIIVLMIHVFVSLATFAMENDPRGCRKRIQRQIPVRISILKCQIGAIHARVFAKVLVGRSK